MGKRRRQNRTRRRLPALLIAAGFLVCLAAGIVYVDAQMRASLSPGSAPVFSAAAQADTLRLGFFGEEVALPLGWLSGLGELWRDMRDTPPSPVRGLEEALRMARLWFSSR